MVLVSVLSGLSALLIVTSQAAAAPPRLFLLTEESPPYNYKDETTGKLKGRAVENIRALMTHAKVEHTLQLFPWKRAYRRTRTNPNTCLFATNRTPAREQDFLWVGPIITNNEGWAFFQRPDSDIAISSAEDAAHYIVTGLAASASVVEFERKTGAKVLTTSSEKAAMNLLYFGRADLLLTGMSSGPYAARTFNVPPPKIALHWKLYGLYLACNTETDSALIKRLNQLNAELLDTHAGAEQTNK